MGYIVGVLALQGAFKEHVDLFNSVRSQYSDSLEFIEVRTAEQLKQTDALVVPGGESTSISLIAERTNLLKPLLDYISTSKPIWGTCAGLIFLATEIVGGRPGQKALGALDIQVERNAFGRQGESFEQILDFSEFAPGLDSFPAVFIRAPVVSKVLNSNYNSSSASIPQNIIRTENTFKNPYPVQILHKLDKGLVVAVRQGNVLGTSFHPELTSDARFHKWFLDEFVKAK